MNFILEQLQKKYTIILASSSQRRKQLLNSIGLIFEIIVPDIDEEKLVFDTTPQNYCKFLSVAKARSVYHSVLKLNKPVIVITADTIVVLNNEIINKPKDNNDAINILKKLSNNKHKVFTGVSLLSINDRRVRIINRYSETDVYFRKLNNDEIIDYVSTGSPLDKAGGYGIQDDYGCLFVKKINGCYNNVVGLPLELLYEMFRIISLDL